MLRAARYAGLGLAALIIIVAAFAVATMRPGDPALWPPAAAEESVDIFVVSHGYHAGLVLPRDAVAESAGRQGHAALLAVTQRFAPYTFLEIGWGDEGFYTSVPDIASLDAVTAARALFMPGNKSVLHIVGLTETPQQAFASSQIVKVRLSRDGFDAMLRSLDASFARADTSLQPQVLGQGLYGPSLFYRATGTFNILHVCNHWVATQLATAGLPTAPVVATLPVGLLLDLKWRAGAEQVPR